MALRNILTKEEPALRKKSRPVTEFGARTAQLLDDLKETLADANGLGLAAPQVGVLRRAVVIVDNDGTVIELVNPQVTKQSEEKVGAYEGCLSVPGERGWLERAEKVTVEAFDRDGKPVTLKLEEMAARAACHEIDHLDGTLFTDLVDRIYTDEELDELLSEEK